MKRFWEAMETGFAEGGPSYRLKEVLAADYPLYARYLEPAGRCAETYALAATGEELPLLPRDDMFLAPTESDEVLHLPLEEVEILRFRHARLTPRRSRVGRRSRRRRSSPTNRTPWCNRSRKGSPGIRR